jgi:hypothetical protein
MASPYLHNMLAGAAFALAIAFTPARAQDVAARIDGAPLYSSTLQAMRHELPAGQGLDELIAQRVLAKWVRTRFSAAERQPASMVGFAKDVAIDDKLVAVLRRMDPNLRHDVQILDLFTPAPALLDDVFGKPGKLRLDYLLSEEQAALARQAPLLRFAIGTTVTLSVHDVLRRHGALALADLRQALADQIEVHAAMTLYGVAEGGQAQSALQSAFARNVTQAEIDAYYAAHKQLFTRVERVRARHIQLRSEAQARAIAAMGGDFATLALPERAVGAVARLHLKLTPG